MFDIYSIPAFSFPKNFLWGSATAGHQIEGNNTNSGHWHWEQESTDPKYEKSGMACNSYNMWREDIDLLSKLGHQCYRMSIEWSRIQPTEDTFDQKEVDHYVKILETLKERGIQTNVTLVHFTTPYWFVKKGGFTKLENLVYFEKYCEYIVPKIASLVDFWCVINEFNLADANFKFNSTLFHARGYHIIKKYSNKPVSSAHALVQQHGVRQNDKFDRALQDYKDCFNNEFFFHAIRTGELVVYGKDGIFSKELKDSCDYWAVNSYVRCNLDARKENFRGNRYSFERINMISSPFYMNKLNPECMVHNLTRLMDKPVYITENGCNCDDDDFRIVFLAEYLSAIHDAIKMGVDIRGFLYWSLLDNYEWQSFKPRFGLVDVDREHGFKRTIKPSGYFFKEIIENNGFKPEMLNKYLKTPPRSTYHFDE